MGLPSRLTLHDFLYFLDGGTSILSATDEAGRARSVMLVQHSFPRGSSSLDALPGRLYFDRQLIPQRSDLEIGVVALLRAAEVRYTGPSTGERRYGLSPNALILGDEVRQVLSREREDIIRAMTASIVRFVESEEYLRFPERVEQAADETRYDVWAATDGGNRARVQVRLGRVLGIGIQAVRELLDRDEPLATGLTAMEVVDLATRYRAEGLRVRVQPEFRWRLP